MVAETTGQGGASTRSGIAGTAAQDRGALPIWAWLFIIALVTPLSIYVGALRLSPYRLVLLVVFLPALFYWLSGRAGPIRLPDICVVALCLWSSLSFSVVHSLGEMVDTIGIFWVETLGAYLLGRCYIRTPDAFYAMVRLFFIVGVVVIPFAIYEAVTGDNMIVRIMSKIGPSYWDNDMEPRLGLNRVNGPVPHPIHFGVFFLSLSGVVYYVLGYGLRWTARVGRMLVIALLGSLSLSSGPLVALMAQLYMIIWDGMMTSYRQRWKILAGLSVAGFVVVDLISNRTPFHVVIEYLAFNKHTAYNRIRIWEWGTKNIFDNPVFGLGFNEWARPFWMGDSVDMFWIVGAMRHGIPVWILWLALFFLIFLPVAYRRGLSDRVSWYRTGYLITMFGLFMAGWTVHYWLVTYVLLMFMLGSGVWFLDWDDTTERQGDEADSAPQEEVRTVGYTRFPASRPGKRADLDKLSARHASVSTGSGKSDPRSLRRGGAPRATP